MSWLGAGQNWNLKEEFLIFRWYPHPFSEDYYDLAK